jgi:hypothetical protein
MLAVRLRVYSVRRVLFEANEGRLYFPRKRGMSSQHAPCRAIL